MHEVEDDRSGVTVGSTATPPEFPVVMLPDGGKLVGIEYQCSPVARQADRQKVSCVYSMRSLYSCGLPLFQRPTGR